MCALVHQFEEFLGLGHPLNLCSAVNTRSVWFHAFVRCGKFALRLDLVIGTRSKSEQEYRDQGGQPQQGSVLRSMPSDCRSLIVHDSHALTQRAWPNRNVCRKKFGINAENAESFRHKCIKCRISSVGTLQIPNSLRPMLAWIEGHVYKCIY